MEFKMLQAWPEKAAQSSLVSLFSHAPGPINILRGRSGQLCSSSAMAWAMTKARRMYTTGATTLELQQQCYEQLTFPD